MITNLKWTKTYKDGRLIRQVETIRRKYVIEQGIPSGYTLRVHNHSGYGPSIGWRRVQVYQTLHEALAKVTTMEN